MGAYKNAAFDTLFRHYGSAGASPSRDSRASTRRAGSHRPKSQQPAGGNRPYEDYEDRWKRIVIPLRLVIGGKAVAFVERLTAGTYRVGWYTAAPGWGGYGRQAVEDQAYPTEAAAVDAAILQMRGYWQQLGVELMVQDLNEAFGRWEER